MATEFLATPSINRFYFTRHNGLRTVTDGVTATSTSLTSATAAFTANDVGAAVSGTGIQVGTTIASVTNGTTVVLSLATTASGSGVSVTITQTNTLALATLQTAINTDFASYFSTVPTLVTQPAAPSVALLIVSTSQVLAVSPGQYVGYNYGNWQVLPSSAMAGLQFTPASV